MWIISYGAFSRAFSRPPSIEHIIAYSSEGALKEPVGGGSEMAGKARLGSRANRIGNQGTHQTYNDNTDNNNGNTTINDNDNGNSNNDSNHNSENNTHNNHSSNNSSDNNHNNKYGCCY